MSKEFQYDGIYISNKKLICLDYIEHGVINERAWCMLSIHLDVFPATCSLL